MVACIRKSIVRVYISYISSVLNIFKVNRPALDAVQWIAVSVACVAGCGGKATSLVELILPPRGDDTDADAFLLGLLEPPRHQLAAAAFAVIFGVDGETGEVP